MIERKTYESLEWLGDVGGLFDALLVIGRFFVGPAAAFALNSELLTQVFRKAPKKKSEHTYTSDSIFKNNAVKFKR